MHTTTQLARRVVLTALALALCAALASGQAQKDIVDTAVSAGNFKTLVRAVQAAGLVQALKGNQELTVFAPTDAAFEKLPKGTLDELLKPANRAKLQQILLFHVAQGRVASADLVSEKTRATVQGGTLLVGKSHGNVTVDGAAVTKADLACSNGIIHVIDEVLLPKNIVEKAELAGSFGTLLKAAQAAGLADVLTIEGADLTLFAPTDQAFAKLPKGTLDDLLKRENRGRLAGILLHHILPAPLLLNPRASATLYADRLDVQPAEGFVVGDARVLIPDIRTTTGIIHVVDAVLLPPEDATMTPGRRAQGLIQLAIQRGVPLFNLGNPAGCAAVYEMAARALQDGYRDALPAMAQLRIKEGLQKAAGEEPEARAWTLRRVLDDVAAELQQQAH